MIRLDLDLSPQNQPARKLGISQLFEPIEVENFNEYTGLKEDLSESWLSRDYFDVHPHPPQKKTKQKKKKKKKKNTH